MNIFADFFKRRVRCRLLPHVLNLRARKLSLLPEKTQKIRRTDVRDDFRAT